MIVISSSWMDPLTIQWYPSLSFLMALILKSLLSDMSIVTLAFLSCPLACNLFFHPLTFNLYVSFALSWFSCRQQIVGYSFFIQSATLCLLIGAFSPLTFKVIIDRCVFIATFTPCFPVDSVFLFFSFFGWMISFYLMLVSSFKFLWMKCLVLICGCPVFQVC